MSAICGVFNRGGQKVRPDTVGAMLDAMAHRAPDGRALRCAGEICLGHGALHSTPESVDEALPIAAPDGLVITGDLRLDNRRELIRQLDLVPSEDRTIGDGELVLGAYRQWGQQAPTYIEGAFAFAIWDSRSRELFCARDHLGAKPFTYHLSRDLFAFSSEVDGVLSVAAVQRRVNEVAIADFLAVELEGVDHTSTMYQDVFRLPPATTLIVKSDGQAEHRYWQPDPTAVLRLRRDEDYVEAFQAGLRDAVRACLRSAAPAAVLMSGGIDSTAIAAVAANEQRRRSGPVLRTHSVARDIDEPDLESECIRAMVVRLGCDSTVATLSRVSAMDAETRRAGLHSGNFFDCIMTVQDLVYRSQRVMGTRVVLDGVDGNVVLALGRAHIAQLIGRGQRIRAFRESWAASRRRASASHPWSGLFAAARTVLVPDRARRFLGRFRRSIGDAPRPYQTSIINQDFADRVDLEARIEYLDSLHWFESSGDARKDQADSLTHPFIAAALERYDRVASRYGIDARHPMLTLAFVEFCLSMPWHLKMRNGWTKYVLRLATAGKVPEIGRWRIDKNDVFWAYTSAVFAEEKKYVSRVIERNRDALAPYVDLGRLHAIMDRLEVGVGPIEEESLWCATALALWLEREGLYH